MRDFNLHLNTKYIFGKDKEEEVGKEVKKHSTNILLHYGQGSIKKTGLYDKIIKALKQEGINFTELPGVVPNPRLDLVKEGIRICREKDIDFVLAVGGGSVIDSAKAISIGTKYEGDVWDFYTGSKPKEALKVGTVLTIPAAGSEGSMNSVITNEKTNEKKGTGAQCMRPVFSILNPEITYTLPNYQTACGIVDMMAHLFERYFVNDDDSGITDELCEGVLRTIKKNAYKVFDKPDDYDTRANLMWCSTIAHNGMLNTATGPGDWATHMIEHEISAYNDLAHGAGLAIMFPAWMRYVKERNPKKFDRFFSKVFSSIEDLEGFFKDIGMPVRHNIDDDKLRELSKKAAGKRKIGSYLPLGEEDVYQIYKLAKE
ncbi:MAG: iron-containing alcohol dehydrogenase [Nanobdellota archaeon]